MLMDSRLLEPSRPIIVEVDELRAKVERSQKTFWAPHSTDWENERAAVTTDSRESRYYDGLCEDWKELFRDEKGPWRDPHFREEGEMDMEGEGIVA